MSDRLDALREQADEYAADRQWGFYVMTQSDVGDALREAGDLEGALKAYLEVALLQVNGPRNVGALSEDFRDDHPGVTRQFDPDLGRLGDDVARKVRETAGELGLAPGALEDAFDDVAADRAPDALDLEAGEAWSRIRADVVNVD
jgi:hypothetical protein